MALKLADRVVELSTSTGTGAFTLSGAQAGYQAFSSRLSNGDTTYYTIQGKNGDGSLNNEWEVGVGTYSSGTLTRDTVLDSSNSGSLVNFSAGNKDVFIDLPSEKVITTAGTGISISGNTITNTAPDQIVSLTGAGTTTVTGTYPSFTITSTGGSGGGDVLGPASSTDNAITRFDGTTGKLIQNSTVTIDDNGNVINANSVQLDTTPATVPATVATMSWDDGDGVPSVLLKGGNTTLQVGTQEYARVYNDSGATLTKGQVVYISGAQGNRVAVKLARANLEATSFGTIGLVAESIANGAEGFIIVSGALYKINTTGLTAGATVYLSPSTAGAFTTTKPQAPDQLVVLGWIERVDNIVGSIYVKIDNGYELDELHDVQVTSPQSGNILIYDASTSPIGVWKNANITAGTGISVTNGAGSVTITNSAPDQTVSISGTAPVSVTGTYPNFTVSMPAASGTQNGYLTSTDWTTFNSKGSGTVTSVSGTGSVNGITLTGTVTSSGSLTLGGTLSGIGNSQLTNSTITVNGTSIALGASGTITANTTNALSAGTGLSFTSGTTFDGSVARTLNISTVPVANGGTGQTSYTDGQLLIGNSTGNTLTKSTLTAGSGISITNGAGSITIAATGGGTGTVTSITAGTGLTGGTITTSGTIALADTAVTAGSYTSANITVDAQGRITSASNGSGGGGGTSIGLVRVISTNCIFP